MKTMFQRKEDAFLLISFASLKHWGESVERENVFAEKARLERVAESFFVSAGDVDYNEFLLDWVKANAHEIVYGEEFTYDVSIPDDSHDFNVNSLIEKEKKKSINVG